MTDWQTMDTAPRDRPILVYSGKEGPFWVKYDDGWWWEVAADHLNGGHEVVGFWWHENHDNIRGKGLTHWLPLPPAPEGQTGC